MRWPGEPSGSGSGWKRGVRRQRATTRRALKPALAKSQRWSNVGRARVPYKAKPAPALASPTLHPVAEAPRTAMENLVRRPRGGKRDPACCAKDDARAVPGWGRTGPARDGWSAGAVGLTVGVNQPSAFRRFAEWHYAFSSQPLGPPPTTTLSTHTHTRPPPVCLGPHSLSAKTDVPPHTSDVDPLTDPLSGRSDPLFPLSPPFHA